MYATVHVCRWRTVKHSDFCSSTCSYSGQGQSPLCVSNTNAYDVMGAFIIPTKSNNILIMFNELVNCWKEYMYIQCKKKIICRYAARAEDAKRNECFQEIMCECFRTGRLEITL